MTPLERICFVTGELPIANRQEAIREYYGRLMQRMEYSPLTDVPIELNSEALPLDGIMVGASTYSGLHVERTPELLTDGKDDVMLCLLPAGAHASLQTGLSVEIAPGDFFLGSLNHRLKLQLPATTMGRTTMFQLPRTSLGGLADVFDDRPLRSIPGKTSELSLLLAYARSVLSLPLDSAVLRQTASKHLIDLATLAIGASREAREIAIRRGARAGQLAVAKRELLKYLADPNLSAPSFAAKLRISTRYLHLLFELEENSFSEHVMQQRLVLARDLLVDPRRFNQRITDIALEVGFKEIRTFNRAFRRHYGMTPSECREQAIKGTP